jgi:hypothetical protein
MSWRWYPLARGKTLTKYAGDVNEFPDLKSPVKVRVKRPDS